MCQTGKDESDARKDSVTPIQIKMVLVGINHGFAACPRTISLKLIGGKACRFLRARLIASVVNSHDFFLQFPQYMVR